MTIRFSKPFIRDYDALHPQVQTKVDKFLRLLSASLKHPSLRVHKMVNQPDIFEARVDLHHRVTFAMQNKIVVMRRVGTHEIYKKP